MLRTLKKRWRTLLLLTVLTFCAVQVTRTALAGPPVTPRPADVAAADRVAEPLPHQLVDPRVDRPEGEWVGGLGLVEPSAPESRLAPGASGRVARIHVAEGQFVTAGTLLVELESGSEEAAVLRSEAEVEVARAALTRARGGVRPEELEAITAEASGARARSALSTEALARLEAAAAGGGATRDEVERARRTAEADRFAEETASARVRGGRSGRREDVLVATAELRAAEARLAEAQARLSLLRITAPIDGEVLAIHYRVGEYVSPTPGSEPVVVLGDTRQLRVRIDVDERDIGRIAMGAAAIVTVDAYPGRRFAGRIVEIGRHMGRKNIRTDEPTERVDVKILEVVVALDEMDGLVTGQRVMGYLTPSAPR
jgi:HlyD family secretion protein